MRNLEQNLPAGQFILLCNPAWSRVYTEISHSQILTSANDDELANALRADSLPWLSEPIKSAFIRLTGFDPVKVQYADIDAQHHALNAAREVERALFVADEIDQLDGYPALEFANGWMSAREALVGSHDGQLDEEVILIVATRYFTANYGTEISLNINDQPGPFLRGFKKRILLGSNFVA